MTNQDLSFIEQGNPWYMFVLSYGATHSVMVLALHHNDPVPIREVVLGGVEQFAGEINGGPYNLRLFEEESESGMRWRFLVAADGSLKIKFLRASVRAPGKEETQPDRDHV